MADPAILLAGADSLSGREFRDAFRQSGLKNSVIPVGTASGVSALLAVGDSGDDVELVAHLDAELAANAAVLVVAASSEELMQLLEQLEIQIPIIDLSGSLRGRPGARLRDPEFEAKVPKSAVHSVPHPASFMLAHLLAAAQEISPVLRAVATILEPASQSGSAAISELQQQAISLLTFKKLPQEIFDAQLAFNMLARTGAESKVAIVQRQALIAQETTSLLALHGEKIPTPSVRLLQAPVFHSYGLSLWLELGKRIPLDQFSARIVRPGIDVYPDDPPANISVAGQAEISVGAIEADPANGSAFWLWAAMDNIRQPASLAIELLREML